MNTSLSQAITNLKTLTDQYREGQIALDGILISKMMDEIDILYHSKEEHFFSVPSEQERHESGGEFAVIEDKIDKGEDLTQRELDMLVEGVLFLSDELAQNLRSVHQIEWSTALGNDSHHNEKVIAFDLTKLIKEGNHE